MHSKYWLPCSMTIKRVGITKKVKWLCQPCVKEVDVSYNVLLNGWIPEQFHNTETSGFCPPVYIQAGLHAVQSGQTIATHVNIFTLISLKLIMDCPKIERRKSPLHKFSMERGVKIWNAATFCIHFRNDTMKDSLSVSMLQQ